MFHATAREDNGLARIELWADDMMIDAMDAEEPTTNLVLYSSWMPTFEGEHQIIARAISADDISGQSTILINAVPVAEDGTGAFTSSKKETLWNLLPRSMEARQTNRGTQSRN